jgi:uncharacterized membrane protein
MKAGVDPSAQIHWLLGEPSRFLIIAAAFGEHIVAYTVEFIGFFGWLTIPLPLGVYLCAIAALALNAGLLRADRTATVVEAVWSAAVFLATAYLVGLAQYLTWTPVGAVDVMGVQGRYFLPGIALLATFGSVGSTSRTTETRARQALSASLSGFVVVCSLLFIVYRYRPFA